MSEPIENTDTKLFRENESDYYSASCHMTKDRRLGINVGGTVIEASLKDWHLAASKLEQKDKEIAELKEDNIRLRNAQEIGGNMYGHKLNEVSALHKQVESLTERVEAAEEVIAKVKPHLTVYASGYFLDNNTEVVEIIEKYNSLKSKTK